MPLPVAYPPALSRPRRLTTISLFTIIGTLLLLLLVVGAAIVSLVLYQQRQAATTIGAPGHVFFQDDAQGHAAQLRIELQHASAPPDGQSYFAWLQDATQQTRPLGPLTAKNGTYAYLYPGDTTHTNLLSITQGVLVTLEKSGSQPATPGGQPAYQAHFDPKILPFLQGIHISTPGLPNKQSVIINLLDTLRSMNDKAGSIVDVLQGNHENGLVIRQATRIIEQIDGSAYATQSGDRPTQDPSQLNLAIGLLSSPNHPGYVELLAKQLDQLKAQAAGNTALLQHIQNTQNAIADLQDWLLKIRTFDVELLKAADLNDPAVIGVALHLRETAADSYTGRTIPPNEGPLPIPGSAGATQAYSECLYLATLDLQAAK